VWEKENQRWRDWCEVDGQKPQVDCRDKVAHIEKNDRLSAEDDAGGRAFGGVA